MTSIRVRPNCRYGMTLLELLTTIGIIGLLIALLLPALGAARASVQRATCQSRLAQLGVALQAYESDHQTFPPAGADERGWTASPLARMLPYLEHGALFDQLNWSQLPNPGPGPSIYPIDNATAARSKVTTFLCPPASAKESGTNFFACAGRGPQWEPAFQGGHLILYRHDPWGFFEARLLPVRRIDLLRGASQVVAFSERLKGDGEPAWMDARRDVMQNARLGSLVLALPPNQPFAPLCQKVQEEFGTWAPHFSDAGHSWLFPGLGRTSYSHALPPNSPIMDCGFVNSSVPYGAVTARSYHSGGVNVLYVDGRVQFVSNSVDHRLWLESSVAHPRAK
jgi:prepilin-type processing-associated H-X9-DG protein/prepilin-type N-terminal cleavage/methylation domain-containing protein